MRDRLCPSVVVDALRPLVECAFRLFPTPCEHLYPRTKWYEVHPPPWGGGQALVNFSDDSHSSSSLMMDPSYVSRCSPAWFPLTCSLQCWALPPWEVEVSISFPAPRHQSTEVQAAAVAVNFTTRASCAVKSRPLCVRGCIYRTWIQSPRGDSFREGAGTSIRCGDRVINFGARLVAWTWRKW